MALNLVRSNLSPNSSRPLLITLIQYRTHFTKTPNHHTKAKWRPFRREKILDVSEENETEDDWIDSLLRSRSIYRISIEIDNCGNQILLSNANISNAKAFRRSVVLNTNRSTSMRQVTEEKRIVRCCSSSDDDHSSRTIRGVRSTRGRRKGDVDVTWCKSIDRWKRKSSTNILLAFDSVLYVDEKEFGNATTLSHCS